MPYLNIDLDYFHHPKTLILESELGGHRATLIPIKLWAHTGKYHSEDGFLRGYSPASLAKAVDFDHRDAEKIITALIKAGFIEKKKDGYLVHDWNEHNGHLALFRERAKNAANARWNKSKPAENTVENSKKPAPPSKNSRLFTEDQEHELRIAIAKSAKHMLISDANEVAWQDLKGKLEKAVKSRKIENLFNYAMKSAMNYGNNPK